ncbi:hypothetical protein E4T38_02986 [Aureobasidium subglaciale]|nr:hypothetical protein E4T38_02986 [Aureobasidium subglaciale]KAI5226937.1 hypothetical protein E4T40_02760 [Aureobasidium subglaciale]KAI5230116.1 hypothetical protein E4T41_02983 [Aureobasidium subglaciale]KAI5264727.1 hypothetical protein E4T46_02761 [Aureobasidium subglaciale]
MSGSIIPTSDDRIVEPIEEAIIIFDDLLDKLRMFLFKNRDMDEEMQAAHGPEIDAFRSSNPPKVTVSDTMQNILHGFGGRGLVSLAKSPVPDSLEAFNEMGPKISQQSINTSNAMLPHIIYRITDAPEIPAGESDKMADATVPELYTAICPRLALGNDVHMTFKRVGKATLEGLQRMKEQKEEWASIWEDGMKLFEPETVALSFNQIQGALKNLEETMKGCLRNIHALQMKKGW